MDGIHNHPLHHHKGTCNYTLLTHLDEDGKTNDILVSLCFFCFFIIIEIRFSSMNETKNLQHLDCSRLISVPHDG